MRQTRFPCYSASLAGECIENNIPVTQSVNARKPDEKIWLITIRDNADIDFIENWFTGHGKARPHTLDLCRERLKTANA